MSEAIASEVAERLRVNEVSSKMVITFSTVEHVACEKRDLYINTGYNRRSK